MNTPSPISVYPAVLLLFLFACQSPSRDTDRNTDGRYAYHPKAGNFSIVSDIPNPEITTARLLDDRRQDSLAAATIADGRLTLDASQLPLNEVYFLEISGKSNRTGTSGLDWTEYVPIFFDKDGTKLNVGQRSFDHPGSISGVKFSVLTDGDEQQLLNEWQNALNDRQADEEGRMVHYTLGGSGSKKVDTGDEQQADEDGITQRFIQQEKPSIASLFLAYTSNSHRKYAAEYEALYGAVSGEARQTKYGVDLRQRLDRIGNPVRRIALATQLVAVDPGLNRLKWSDFDTYDYLLLAFWNSMDKAAHADVKQLEDQAHALEQQETAVIHISVDSRLSQWKKMSQPLNLRHNYKLRNEVQQPLIDSLYMTELPRYVLIQPDGNVIDADVSLDELPQLLKQALTNR